MKAVGAALAVTALLVAAQLATAGTAAAAGEAGTAGTAGAAGAADRPLDTSPAAGLAVYTTPDPSPVASSAYVYSPTALSAAPTLKITGPGLQARTITTVFSHAAAPGDWWTAPLPGGTAGIRTVAASGRTSAGAAVSGHTTYEITGTSRALAPRWTSSGPGAVGGLLAVPPQDPTSLYVASALSAEVYASHDAGTSWQLERTLPVAGGYPTSLLALGGPRARLVLSVNGGNGGYVDDPTYTGAVLESANGGKSWRNLGMPDAFVESVQATADGHTLAAVTGTGLEITSDDGATWRHVSIPWGATDYAGASFVGNDLYVATFKGLYVLRDAATTTAAPVLAFTPPNGRSAWVTQVTGDAQTVYATAWSGGVFSSTDGGATWTHRYDPQGFVSMFDDVAGSVYTVSGNTLAIGRDGGQTWTSEAVPVQNATYNGVYPAGGRLYLSSTDSGVLESTDNGATFSYVNGVPVNTYSVAVAHGRVVAGTGSDTYTTSQANATAARPAPWGPPQAQAISGTAIPLLASTPDDSLTYKVRAGPRIGTFTIYSSPDGGTTWSSLGLFYGTAYALLIDPADPADVYVTSKSGFAGNNTVVSHDAGKTWTTVPAPDTGLALAGDPTDPAKIWLGGPGGLWSSTDGGTTFTHRDSTPVSALQTLADHRLVIGGSQLRYSDNGGRTVRTAVQPSLDISVPAIVASPTRPTLLFAASAAFHDAGLLKGGHGVLASVDGGGHWFEFNDGLDDLDVTSLAISHDGRRLFAGTTQGGVFTIPVLLTS